MNHTSERKKRVREKMRALVGEGNYQIRVNGTVEIYNNGWHPIGRWVDLEEKSLTSLESLI